MNAPPPQFEPMAREELDWLGTDPVPAHVYHDPAWYALECEAVFKRTWLPIGHVCELPEPGSFIRRELEFARTSLLIVRGRDGEIRAFHNVCTHRGTELVAAESGRQATFSCRYHMWTFGQDGSLLSAPDFERFYVDKAACALKQVALDVVGGLIFVHLTPPRQPLREFLGELAEGFEGLAIAKATQFVEYTYEIQANWKLAYDNFQENYHLRFVHPRTGGPGCTEDNPFAYPARYNFWGPHRSQTIWTNPSPPPMAFTQELTGRQIVAAAGKAGLFGSPLDLDFIALFPNFTLFGLPVRHFTQAIWPLGPDRCRGVIRFYWVGEPANASEAFAREYVMASQRDIHCEDRDIVQAGQVGLSSGAIDQVNFQDQEALCRHLYNAVAGMVRQYQAERARVPA